MNVDLGIWSKLTRVAVFLVVVAILLLVAVWYLPLFQQNERMRQRSLQLDTQIQKQELQAKELKASIEALRHDPKAVERLVRENLGYAKPGETVIRFDAPATNSAPAAR
jgi:cell division protein FtsB